MQHPVLGSSPGLLDALRGEMTPKFLATRSADARPNVVPLISLQPGDEPDLLFFGNFLLRKSIKNLEADPRVGILVVTTDLRGWRLTGEFLRFERTGPYVERQMSSSLLRYNAYTGVRNAGLIRVTRVDGLFAIPKLQVVADYLADYVAARVGSGKGAAGDSVLVPRPVRTEFARLTAVKVLAWLRDDGYPTIVPALSMQPAGECALSCWLHPTLPAPPPGAAVATNILTLDAVSYQARGQWSQRGRLGMLHVKEVYAGGPPYPGGRVA